MNKQLIILVCCAGLLNAQLYFKSGYEPGTTQDGGLQNYSGFDSSTGYNWNVFGAGQVKGISGVENMYWNCAQPGVDAFAKIITDPAGTRGKILQATVVNHNPTGTVCRFEYDETFSTPDTATRCVKYDYMLDTSMNAVKSAPSFDWFLISEIWSTGATDDRASIPMYIDRNGSTLSWEIDIRYITPTSGDYVYPWTVYNTTVPVQIGKWMNFVLLFKPGLAGTGRFFFSVDGQTVFDINDKDLVWNNQTWAYWCCQKLYLGPNLVDFMRNRGTPATCYYDNYEVWGGMPTTSTHAASQRLRPGPAGRLNATTLLLIPGASFRGEAAAEFDLRGSRLDRMAGERFGYGSRAAERHCVVVAQSK